MGIKRLLFLLGYRHTVTRGSPTRFRLPKLKTSCPPSHTHCGGKSRVPSIRALLPGYVVVEESSLVLRGRLRETEQLHRHHGLPLPLEIRHDEFTVDIPENQILRAACERMLTVPRVDDESSRMLRRLLRNFGDVSSVGRGDPVPSWQPSRINSRYHTALRLAELVLRATSVEHEAGTVAVNGFLIDMPLLFEDFVTIALREALEAAYGGRVAAQVRSYLDTAGRVVLKPDIVSADTRVSGRGH